MTDTQAATGGGAARAKIAAKLRALLAMTVENGCTGAEAMIAAQKAAELMQQHDLTCASVEDVKADRLRCPQA
jgi:hypothetical protein